MSESTQHDGGGEQRFRDRLMQAIIRVRLGWRSDQSLTTADNQGEDDEQHHRKRDKSFRGCLVAAMVVAFMGWLLLGPVAVSCWTGILSFLGMAPHMAKGVSIGLELALSAIIFIAVLSTRPFESEYENDPQPQEISEKVAGTILILLLSGLAASAICCLGWVYCRIIDRLLEEYAHLSPVPAFWCSLSSYTALLLFVVIALNRRR